MSKSPLDANFSEIHSGKSFTSKVSCSSTSPANANTKKLAYYDQSITMRMRARGDIEAYFDQQYDNRQQLSCV